MYRSFRAAVSNVYQIWEGYEPIICAPDARFRLSINCFVSKPESGLGSKIEDKNRFFDPL